MRLGLVPVGGGGVEVRTVVGVPVFDGHADGFAEGDRVGDVEPVDGRLGAGLEIVLLEGTAVKQRLAFPHPPTVGEIVLRACAVERRKAFTVDIDLVVAFAPPAHSPLQDAHVAADIVAAAFGLQDRVIAARSAGEFLPVLGVEIGRARRQGGELAVIHVIIKGRNFLPAFIGDRHLRRTPEGHVPVTVASPALGRAGDGQGGEVAVETMADAEEIADRRLDRRRGFAVPINAQDELAAVERLGGDGHPDMVDGPGAFEIGQEGRPARRDGQRILVAAAAVVG